jgi:hypothetical protein
MTAQVVLSPLAFVPYGQSLALRYPACCASASVANGTADAGRMPAQPLQPGTRYTLLLRFPWTSSGVWGIEAAGEDARLCTKSPVRNLTRRSIRTFWSHYEGLFATKKVCFYSKKSYKGTTFGAKPGCHSTSPRVGVRVRRLGLHVGLIRFHRARSQGNNL